MGAHGYRALRAREARDEAGDGGPRRCESLRRWFEGGVDGATTSPLAMMVAGETGTDLWRRRRRRRRRRRLLLLLLLLLLLWWWR